MVMAADANSSLAVDNSDSWQPYLQHLHGGDIYDGEEGLPYPNVAAPASPFDMPLECLWSDFGYPDSPIHVSAENQLDSANVGMDMFMPEESIRLNNLACFGTHMFESEMKLLTKSIEEGGGGSPPCERQRELEFYGGHTKKIELKESCGASSFIDPNVDNDFGLPQSISCESMWLIANESYMDDTVVQIPTDHSFGATMCSNGPYARSTNEHIRESLLVSGDDDNINGDGNVVSDLISLCPPTKSTSSTAATTSSATLINPSKTKFSTSSSSSTSSMPSTLSISSKSTSSTTAVVYPFALVKPSWVQGHITLQDINDRILSPTTRVSDDIHDHHSSKRPRSMKNILSPGLIVSSIKRKSVVALTRINTEGNGSITIVRTKD